MLLFAYVPMLAWVLSGFMAIYYRSLYHRAHVFGQTMCALILFGFQAFLPAFRASSNPTTTCASQLPERPAEEVAFIFFMFLFVASFDARASAAGSKRIAERPCYLVTKLLGLLLLCVFSAYAQVYLHLFNAEQVLLALVGSMLAAAIFNVLFYHVLFPFLKHEFLRSLLTMFVREESIDNYYEDRF
jgi:hypothetical protein